MYKKICEVCKKKGGKGECDGKEGPVCVGYSPVPLEQNIEAWDFWKMFGNQIICSSSGDMIALNYGTLKILAETVGVEWNAELLKRLQYLEHLQIEARNSGT